MTVRLAGRADEAAVYELLTGPDGLYADNAIGLAYSRDKVMARIRLGTEGRGGIIGVIDGDHELAGSIGLFFDSPWYSEETYLAELWLFVRPDYRSHGYSAALFRFAKDCRGRLANGSGLPLWLMTSVVSRKRLPAKLRLWRQHAELIGGIFLVEGA